MVGSESESLLSAKRFNGHTGIDLGIQRLKDKSGAKWILDMLCMISSWNVRFGAQKPHIDAFFSWLFLADSTKTL